MRSDRSAWPSAMIGSRRWSKPSRIGAGGGCVRADPLLDDPLPPGFEQGPEAEAEPLEEGFLRATDRRPVRQEVAEGRLPLPRGAIAAEVFDDRRRLFGELLEFLESPQVVRPAEELGESPRCGLEEVFGPRRAPGNGGLHPPVQVDQIGRGRIESGPGTGPAGARGAGSAPKAVSIRTKPKSERAVISGSTTRPGASPVQSAMIPQGRGK